MTLDQLKNQKDVLYYRLAFIAGKPFCLFRLIRMRILNKRLDSLNRGLGAGKPQ